MEKVVISKEIAEAIESRLFYLDTKEVLLTKHVERIGNGKRWQNSNLLPLNDISIEDLAKALYIGYEIEKPKFQPGDKVIQVVLERGEKPSISVLEKLKEGTREEAWWYEGGMWDYTIDFRHATSEEIYWLGTLGREKVGDFQIDDMYLTSKKGYFRINNDADIFDMKQWYKRGDFGGIYPAESFKPFPEEESE